MSESSSPYAPVWEPGDPVYEQPALPPVFRPGKTQIGTRTTPRHLVRVVKPQASDAECDFLLWEQSCFPFGSVGQWFVQVREALASPPMASPAPERDQ